MYGGDFSFTPAPVAKKNLEELLRLFEEIEALAPYKKQILCKNACELFIITQSGTRSHF